MTPWRGAACQASGLETARTPEEQRIALARWERAYLLWLARTEISYAYAEARRHPDPRRGTIGTNCQSQGYLRRARTSLQMARRAALVLEHAGHA